MQTARRLVKGPDTAETSKKYLAFGRNHKTLGEDSQGFTGLWESIQKYLQGFGRIRETLGEDSQGFTRLWERICKDSQDFGRGFRRNRKDS